MPILTPSFSVPNLPMKEFVKTTEPKPEPPAAAELPTVSSKVPRVVLDVDVVSSPLAARLATTLLSHILFLKNQVPFPVAQLNRLPVYVSKNNPRATKHKSDLLASFDTLSSHLLSTFSSLSTAFARSKQGQSSTQQAFLLFSVGPSITSAKARVVFAVDGFEVKLWGQRDELLTEEDGDESSDSEETDEADEEDDSDESNGSHSDDAEEPYDSEPEDSDNDSESDDSDDTIEPEDDARIARSPSPEPEPRPLGPAIVHYASLDEERIIKNAERLLLRALTQFEADGAGMADELAPTQSQVLLRAPRRFLHPSWLPQQNVSSVLDKALNEFIVDASTPPPTEQDGTRSTKPKRSKIKPEGIWVCTKTAQEIPHLKSVEDGDEDSEMIWWSWEGKIVGFSDL